MKNEEKKAEAGIKDSVIPKGKEKNLEKHQEIGGRGGLDPSRFGDWEIAGRCVDF